jgi:signal transduction histidine kinase
MPAAVSRDETTEAGPMVSSVDVTGDVARRGSWLTDRLRLMGRGLVLYVIASVAGMTIFNLMTNAISLIAIGIGLFLVPAIGAASRALVNSYRRLVGKWTGVEITEPYLPEPPLPDGAARPEPSTVADHWRRTKHMLTDPATWRDLLWMLVDPVVGAFTALLPLWLTLNGVWAFVLALPYVWEPLVRLDGTVWYLFIPVDSQVTALATLPLGAAQVAAGLAFAPALMTAYGRWCRVLLAPTEKSRLRLRVRRLTDTRSEAVDAQAAELRRIERDLHDGAQARLVAMGMSLSQIEHLLDRDPDKARLLLSQARESSALALRELRDLVRGIHPPVLADRGLPDAVRTLALEHPLRVEVTSDVPGRFEPPVESAAYFAIAEMLANAAKHSGAERVWIELGYTAGLLRVLVTDDGHGGAEIPTGPDARPDAGTGLLGIERRLATFDGVLAISSPPGGPTIVTMELPCALSSPRTSSS